MDALKYLNLFLVFLVFLVLSCNSDKPKEKYTPADYLYAQRSFPSGRIDHKAYRKSLELRSTFTSTQRRFDKKWIFKGPTNICGRVTDIEMPSKDTSSIFIGTASGGISMSSDLGDTWQPIFDEVASLSIGDIAISNNDNNVIYVGTGESNAGGGSIAYDGIGVYGSRDKGQTWEALGLEEAGSIGKVVIDPNDDNTVFVASMGSLFANSDERGVYRTKDGGENWSQVLFESDSTGAIDLAIHPQDGNIIYAALWERVRRPYKRQYGGETSGIYKSIDGGETWNELTDGLPAAKADKGRIGLAISPSNPNIVYALYANQSGRLQGVYKTSDAGATWQTKSVEGITSVPYMWWFGRIFVHPNDPDDIYVTSIVMHRSIDGGDSWSNVFTDAHVDHHSIYIHPLSNDMVINGNDGGVNISEKGNPLNSTFLDGLSNFQFYYCKLHPFNPEIIYGGSQDNGTIVTYGDTASWSMILGGDGFRVLVDPADSLRIYAIAGGNFYTSNNGGNNFSFIGNGLSGQRNWSPPIVLDPNSSSVLYAGTNKLFKSENYGGTWTAISPVLSKTDNPIGNIFYGTLTTIDVSTHDSRVIYAGTDDGQLWVTFNGGSDWEVISDDLPSRWMTSVHHDPHVEASVYVTVSGFRFGESEAQVFLSQDYGFTWKAIGTSLPDIPVNELVPDPVLPNVLYIATDIGAFVSDDRGESWQLLGTDLPNVPVTDIDIHNDSRTMAAATFGRGIYTYEMPKLPSSVTESNQDYNIYPNPTSDFIILETDKNVKGISVWDEVGQRVGPLEALGVRNGGGSGVRLSVQHLVAGVYYLTDREGRQFGTFVKL